MNMDHYTKIEHLDGRIELIPKKEDLDWVPCRSDKSYCVSGNGEVVVFYCDEFSNSTLEGVKDFHNVYKTEQQAEKAAELMRRSNAIIRACLLVDPDFVPDWENSNQDKFYPVYFYGKWTSDMRSLSKHPSACVSTFDKAQQACRLLEKWGVK